MIRTELVQSYRSLASAMRAGLIEPVYVGALAHQWRPPSVDPEVAAIASSLPAGPPRRLDRPEDQWEDPARDTRAQIYQDVGYEWNGPFSTQVYEIGRFSTTDDEVGVVKYCSTYVEIENPSPPPDYLPLDPRDPYALSRASVGARFLLRLRQGTFQPLGPKWSGPKSALHGYGYGPLPEWNDYRFQWGRTANEVKWLVPAGHTLRLYIQIVRNADPVVRILGRMVGYTQPIYTLPAVWNVLHDW